MFTKGFKESTEERVEIKAVPAQGLEAILLYMYNGKIEISLDNITFILAAACHLQVLDVQTYCTEFMKHMLSAENCAEFCRLSNLYALESLEKVIIGFMLNNYSSVCQNEKFKDLSIDLLCELLAKDTLKAESELVVFKSAIRWLQAAPERHIHAEKVLKLVRYGLMTPTEMQVVYANDDDGIMMQPSCRKLLRNALDYHMNVFQQPIKQAAKAYPRCYVNSLLVVGGCRTRNIVNDAMFSCRVQKSQLKEFKEIGTFKPKEARSDAAVALLNNFLFVAGGEAEVDKRTSRPTCSVYRFNPRDGRWLQIASMNKARKCFPLVAFSNMLFATGGSTEKNRILDSTETYSFTENEWTEETRLDFFSYAHAAGAHKGLCYISGGSGYDLVARKHVQCYDPAKKKWEERSSMNQARVHHAMVSYKDTLLVCGGRIRQGDPNSNNVHTMAKPVEMYDVQGDQWTNVTQMPINVFKPAVACFGTFIFIVGGNDENNAMKRKIQCYDTASDKWIGQTYRELPVDMEGMVAGYLRLGPKVGGCLPTYSM